MAGFRYVRILKSAHSDAKVCGDDSSACCAAFKSVMVERYHELRRVIDSLLPEFLSNRFSGMTGIATNSRLINSAFLHADYCRAERNNNCGEPLDVTQRRRIIFSQRVQEPARQLDTMWNASGKRLGWMSAQVDPFPGEDTGAGERS